MNIGIYGRVIKDENIPFVQWMFDEITKREMGVVVHEGFLGELKEKVQFGNPYQLFSDETNLTGKIDYLISLGGDGTLLDTVTLVNDSNIPVLGINIGRLGFLSTVGKEDISSALDALENKSYELDKKDLLHLSANKPLFEPYNYALNEFTVVKRDTASMIVVHTYINGEFVNSFWADGLIVSTATGSTAYSLSCGGPIILPTSKTFVITPVAPHNLNVRPIIVPHDSIMEFDIEGRQDSFLCSLDSRHKTINSSFHLKLRREKFSFNMIRLKETSFLSTIRSKLLWGFDKRNF
jgi:NAD+ kinase